jgi:hypothetical protein
MPVLGMYSSADYVGLERFFSPSGHQPRGISPAVSDPRAVDQLSSSPFLLWAMMASALEPGTRS